MYERFTERARKVMALANQEALRFRHEYVGTEHILLGLIQEGAGVAAVVLKNLDINLLRVRQEIEKLVWTGPEVVQCSKLPQTPRAKKVIEFAIEEARALGHNHIGTEHMLLGLLREEEGVAAQVLLNLGLKLNDVREEVICLVGHDNPKKTKAAPEEAKRTPTLDAVGENLTELARQGKLTPVVGRQDEIDRLLLIIAGVNRPGALLVGETGVGKRTLVEAVARRIAEQRQPERAWPVRVVALSYESLQRGIKEGGQTAERFESCLNEARQSRVLLYLEDLRPFLTEQNGYVAAILLRALRHGPVPLIAALNTADHFRHLPKGHALDSQLETVLVQPMSGRETVEVLRGRREQFEKHHGVVIADTLLARTVELAERHLEGCLPGTALRLLDQASASARRHVIVPLLDLDGMDVRCEQLLHDKERAIAQQDFEKAVRYRDEFDRLRKQMEARVQEWQEAAKNATSAVDENALLTVVAKMANMAAPPSAGIEADRRLLRMEAELAHDVTGQDEALAALARVVRHNKAGLGEQGRPLGSFLFVGPPHSGKVHLARRLAAFLFGDENAVVRLDMNDFAEKHMLGQLVGVTGRLTEPLRRRPWSVVLLEHIDRAHLDVWGLLGPLVEQGRLTDGMGRTLDLRHAVVVLTTTAACEELTSVKAGKAFNAAVEERVRQAVRRVLPAEHVDRLDEVLVLRPLSNDAVNRMVDLELAKVAKRLAERGLELMVTDEVRRHIVDESDPTGEVSQPVRRAVERLLVDPLSEELLKGTMPTHGILIARLAVQGGRKTIQFDNIIASDSPELTNHPSD